MMAAWRLSKMCSGHRKHNAKVFRVILKEDVKMAKGMSNSACIRIMPLKFSKMDSLEKPKMCIFDSVNTVSLHTASKTHILGFYKRSILENSETLSGCMQSSITPLANLTSSFIITRKILTLCFPCPEHILDNLHAVIKAGKILFSEGLCLKFCSDSLDFSYLKFVCLRLFLLIMGMLALPLMLNFL
ncbi:hypothetical protein ACFX2G_044326 [Malus domestica]